MLYRLGVLFGCDPEEVERRLTPRQIRKWTGYYLIEPWTTGRPPLWKPPTQTNAQMGAILSAAKRAADQNARKAAGIK